LFIVLLFVKVDQPNLADLCRLRVRINLVTIVQGARPLGAIILVKFEVFKVLKLFGP